MNNEYLTVSDLNSLIRDVVNLGFPSAVWVCGEIQGYSRNKDKKHIFFELCEKDPKTKDIIARIGLVIFSGRKAHMEQILKSAENAFQLKDDIEVKFLCKVDFYPPHGAMRLIVESIDPVYTLGKIAQERQKLLAKLKSKGILDKNKEIPLPLVPLNIGLITAHESAAYNDFLSELKMSGFGFKVFHENALMQGRGAEPDVCQALEDLSRIKNLDVIVITRGGGSIADLSCFDSEAIAEKIAAVRLPVLSGIGHEINITVTDIAAHAHQKTPTAIAQFLIQRIKLFLADAQEKICGIIHATQEKLDEEQRRLKDFALDLQSDTSRFLKTHDQELIRFSDTIKRQPLRSLKESLSRIDEKKDLLLKNLSQGIKNTRTKIHSFERIVMLADPVHTLRRGFSITRTKGGEVLKSIKKVKEDDPIMTQLSDGSLESRIITKEERHG